MLISIIGIFLSVSALVSPAQAFFVNVNQSTFVLSNEGGGLISQLIAGGYGEDNLYQALVDIARDANPSVAEVLMPAFLQELKNAPLGSQIFTHHLSEYTGSGQAVAINSDGTAQVVSIFGATYYGQAKTATLNSNISGVGDARFTYTTDSSSWNPNLTSWVVNGPLENMTTTYNVFGIGWVPGGAPPPGTTTVRERIWIAGGDGHTVALKEDGTVWAWGNNANGQLGDGTTTERHTPVQVSGLSNIIAIAAGSDHTIALKQDGTVWGWGSNSHGQLGDGTTTDRHTPVQVSGLSTNVTAITAERCILLS